MWQCLIKDRDIGENLDWQSRASPRDWRDVSAVLRAFATGLSASAYALHKGCCAALCPTALTCLYSATMYPSWHHQGGVEASQGPMSCCLKPARTAATRFATPHHSHRSRQRLRTLGVAQPPQHT